MVASLALALIAGAGLVAAAYASDETYLKMLRLFAVGLSAAAIGSCTILAFKMRGRKTVASVHRTYRMP